MNRPVKLLYIEDDEVDKRAFFRMVREKGLSWEVTLAPTLAAARNHLGEGRFDVIVADYHLPDGRCTELFDEVPGTPFVLLTATLEEHLALRTLERGADDYLPKDPDLRHLTALPFTVEKTLHRLRIHEREQRLARELRESEERFAAFMNHLPGAAWIKDLHGRYVYANPEAERIFSTPLHAMQGKTDEDIFPPETARQFRENDRRVLAEGGSLQTTEVLRQADGREHYSLVSKFVVRGPDGQAAYIGGVAFDITERQQVEEALRDSEERFRAIFDNAAIAIALGSLDGRCVHANKAACDFIGRSPEEVVGLGIEDIVHPDDRHLTSGLLPRLIAGEIPSYTVERRYIRKDKGVVWGRASVSLVRDSAGRPKNIIGVMADITERKQADEALRQTAAELTRSNDDLEQFAYVASHDLQEPLRQVSGFMGLLRQRYADKLDATAGEYIGYAVDGAKRMSQLVSDLLAYSRVGTRGGETRPTDSDQALQNVLATLQFAIEDSRAIVTHDPLPTIRADVTQLMQLFQNLIGNALKFHGEEPPRIHVSVRPADGMWEFAVRDNGIGMDPAHLERIFQVFQRLHTHDTYPGTGIGLAICKKIVERHGGRIWVESEPGMGSTFRFTMPG